MESGIESISHLFYGFVIRILKVAFPACHLDEIVKISRVILKQKESGLPK